MDVEEDKVSIQKLKFTNFIFYRNSSLKIFISPRSYVGYIFWVGLFAEMLKIYDFQVEIVELLGQKDQRVLKNISLW